MAGMFLRVTALVGGLLLSGCESIALLAGFPEPKISTRAPLPIELAYREGKDGLVILTGRVNDKADVDFVLDTGAPVTVLLDNERTAALGLDTSNARRLGPPTTPPCRSGSFAVG